MVFYFRQIFSKLKVQMLSLGNNFLLLNLFQIRVSSLEGGEVDTKEYFENLDKIYAPDHLAKEILNFDE
jgi:hypothetical protein